MKKAFCLAAFLALVFAALPPLWGYDSSPSLLQIVPEAIYAPATGGGTWSTDAQITNCSGDGTAIFVYFYYNGGSTGPIVLLESLPPFQSVEYGALLAAIDGADSGPLNYFGKVGAVWICSLSLSANIQVQAMTFNGNYGKTAPALNLAAGNTAALGRPMILQHLVQNSDYRTSVGVHNTSDSTTYTVQFVIVNALNMTVGSAFSKILGPRTFRSFNPFADAGVPSGTFSNCWLRIQVTAGSSETAGVMCYGSIANNNTNDTYALIARMYQ